MNEFLSKYFKSDDERISYHLIGDKEFDSKTAFIIGLDGMTCENSMLKGQLDFGHLYSALNQTVAHWTTNFNKTDATFQKLWTDSEWRALLEYEAQFLEIYRILTHWKHEAPKAPELFERKSYKKLKTITEELFYRLTR